MSIEMTEYMSEDILEKDKKRYGKQEYQKIYQEK